MQTCPCRRHLVLPLFKSYGTPLVLAGKVLKETFNVRILVKSMGYRKWEKEDVEKHRYIKRGL